MPSPAEVSVVGPVEVGGVAASHIGPRDVMRYVPVGNLDHCFGDFSILARSMFRATKALINKKLVSSSHAAVASTNPRYICRIFVSLHTSGWHLAYHCAVGDGDGFRVQVMVSKHDDSHPFHMQMHAFCLSSEAVQKPSGFLPKPDMV